MFSKISVIMTTLKTIDGLRIGHANVYRLYNKVHDVCMLLNDSPFIHLLGLGETRLSARFSDESISVPHYNIIRRDAADQGHTGMALYIHQSIKTFTKRRNDLRVREGRMHMGGDKTPSLPCCSSWICI